MLAVVIVLCMGTHSVVQAATDIFGDDRMLSVTGGGNVARLKVGVEPLQNAITWGVVVDFTMDSEASNGRIQDAFAGLFLEYPIAYITPRFEALTGQEGFAFASVSLTTEVDNLLSDYYLNWGGGVDVIIREEDSWSVDLRAEYTDYDDNLRSDNTLMVGPVIRWR